MKGILHIVNGYWSNRVYKNLVTIIDSMGIQQFIYVPIRSAEDKGQNQNLELKTGIYFYSYIIKSILDRLLFFRKIRKITQDIEHHEKFSTENLIHAHTLFSDGAVAYKLHRKYRMNYLLAIRNTDVNFFFKYLFFLRGFGQKILLNAQEIIFLSPSYKELVINRYVSSKNRLQVAQKSKTIPNGIDTFWTDNIFRRSQFDSGKIRLLYVGEIKRNKNIETVVAAVSVLREKGMDVELCVVGFGLCDEPRYAKSLRKVCESLSFIKAVDQVIDKDELLGYFREADIFVMPSFKETFGLVYGEAISQGLPVIYSNGQGIDGYFAEGEVGYGVDPKKPDDIANKIQSIMDSYLQISNFCSDHTQLFDWKNIGLMYKELYKDLPHPPDESGQALQLEGDKTFAG